MASVAIPLLFEAVRIDDDWYGDGAMRDHTPLSAAINLGAQRLLVISTRNSDPVPLPQPPPYPQLGKIAGYVLDSLFMDGIGPNLDRVQRLNELVRLSERAAAGALRPAACATSTPAWSTRASTCARSPPATRTAFRRRCGACFAASARLASSVPLPSYLLFDGAFCRELMDLGYADAQRQKRRNHGRADAWNQESDLA